MFLDSMKYTESYNNHQHTYTFTGKCDLCGEEKSVTVPGLGLFKLRGGEYIQNAFPDLSGDEREFLLSGTCGKCWDKMFPEEEE